VADFCLKSTNPSSSLRFSNLNGDYFDFEVRTPTLTAKKNVYAYNPTHYGQISDFFELLASFRTPWGDEKKWESLEGELAILATCNDLGHVTLKILLSNQQEADHWSVDTVVPFGFGSMPEFAKKASHFFSTYQG
jgi:hypothetical protein